MIDIPVNTVFRCHRCNQKMKYVVSDPALPYSMMNRQRVTAEPLPRPRLTIGFRFWCDGLEFKTFPGDLYALEQEIFREPRRASEKAQERIAARRWVYEVESENKPAFYIGRTKNLMARLERHWFAQTIPQGRWIVTGKLVRNLFQAMQLESCLIVKNRARLRNAYEASSVSCLCRAERRDR